MDDVIDKDMMLDLRPLSYGSATELKSIILTPPLSDKLFIDSLRLEYFSRFLSRFDLSTYKDKNASGFCSGFVGIISENGNASYLSVGALYFVRACIRSLAKCCCADSVGALILIFSRHHSTCRSYARVPNDRLQCGHTSLIGPKLRFDIIDRFINGVSFDTNFGISFVGVTRRLTGLVDASYTLEICLLTIEIKI